MSDTLDRWDVRDIVQDVRHQEIRYDIERAVHEACQVLRGEFNEALRDLREELADALINRGTLA